VTIAAKPVVALLRAVMNRPTVAIYPAWGTLHVLLAAPFKMLDATPVQAVEIAVILNLYILKIVVSVAGIVWVVKGAAGSWPIARVQ
jgi:hypothetical protein